MQGKLADLRNILPEALRGKMEDMEENDLADEFRAGMGEQRSQILTRIRRTSGPEISTTHPKIYCQAIHVVRTSSVSRSAGSATMTPLSTLPDTQPLRWQAMEIQMIIYAIRITFQKVYKGIQRLNKDEELATAFKGQHFHQSTYGRPSAPDGQASATYGRHLPVMGRHQPRMGGHPPRRGRRRPRRQRRVADDPRGAARRTRWFYSMDQSVNRVYRRGHSADEPLPNAGRQSSHKRNIYSQILLHRAFQYSCERTVWSTIDSQSKHIAAAIRSNPPDKQGRDSGHRKARQST
ncbi:hypothetical protein B0H14DRAFT_2618015, partial [Mycena olivaceomarginata]